MTRVALRSGAHRRKRALAETATGLAFAAPALLIYIALIAYPVTYTLVLSLFSWSGLTPEWGPFVGLANYQSASDDPVFWTAVRNTLAFVAIRTPIELTCGLVLALFLNDQLRTTRVARTLLFVPVVLPVLAVAVLFGRIYEPSIGLLNSFLETVRLGDLAHQWLGDPDLALWSVTTVSVWQRIGYSMVILLAGLQALPADVIEAAAIDGANRIQVARYVQIPLLRGAIGIASVLSVIAGLKVFDLVYVMTLGGPLHATEVLVTLLYQYAFHLNRMGVAAAMAVVLAIGVLMFSWIQLRMTRTEAL